MNPRSSTFLSIVTPACNEEQNLPALYERLKRVLDEQEVCWEWIVIDDHSSDGTFEVIRSLAERDERVRGYRFSRNFGSHAAILCGLRAARGDCGVFLAADLQDPPELIDRLLTEWRNGSEVVWAMRRTRRGERAHDVILAWMYYTAMSCLGGIDKMQASGADFFLIDRKVIDVLSRFVERNASVFGLINWMGFTQTAVEYDKQPRMRGESGWTWQKKSKIVADTLTAFSCMPIRLVSVAGLSFTLLGGLVGFGSGAAWLSGRIGSAAGYALLTTVLLIGFGCVMLSLGILGEYLWRALDQARTRPRYIISEVVQPRGGDTGQDMTGVEEGEREQTPAAADDFVSVP